MGLYGIPVPKILASFKYGRWYINNHVVEDADVDEMLKNCTTNRVFVKIASEGAARGVFTMKRDDKNWLLQNKIVTSRDLRLLYGNRNFFIEGQIKQEPVLSSFNPDTVNTIRILTLNNGIKSSIVSAAVRFGRKGSFVDNMHAGGIAVSIDIESGKLESYGGRRFDPVKYYEHPDSHIKFEGTVIPYWNSIIELVHRTLTVLPQYKSVGFDIVTTNSGPLVLEVNTGAGMDLAQVGKLYGIADKFNEYKLHK